MKARLTWPATGSGMWEGCLIQTPMAGAGRKQTGPQNSLSLEYTNMYLMYMVKLYIWKNKKDNSTRFPSLLLRVTKILNLSLLCSQHFSSFFENFELCLQWNQKKLLSRNISDFKGNSDRDVWSFMVFAARESEKEGKKGKKSLALCNIINLNPEF